MGTLKMDAKLKKTQKSDDTEEVSDGYDPIKSNISIAPMIYYSDLVMGTYLDCDMHLVFRRVVAYCIKVLEQFITDHNVHQLF